MLNPNLSTETFPKSEPEIVKLGADIRHLMSEAMTRCKKTAPEVAKEMSERLGRPITGSMIYELTRNGLPQPEIRLLASWVLAFCESTNDDRLQRLLAGPRLRELIELGETVEGMHADGERLLQIANYLRLFATQEKRKAKPKRSKR
jgi:hypothetical protein